MQQSNKTSVRAQVGVDGDVYEPAINRFDVSGQAIGTPSVRTSLTQDVYLTLQRAPQDDAGETAAIRVIVQPMVVWLWIGGGVMALGTILAAFPGRRRNPIDPVSAPLPAAAVDGDGNGSGGRDRSGDGAEVSVTGSTAGGGDGAAGGHDRSDETPDRVEVPT